MGMANALFSRAQSTTEAPKKKADYKAAGEAYAKASALKPQDADLAFNAALSFQNAGEWAASEGAWRNALKARPEDVDAMSSLGAVLAEQAKYDEAARLLHGALAAKPETKTLYRQLGAVYTKAGANAKATELLTLYLAMNQGQQAPDAAAAAGALKGAAATTMGGMGAPDQVWNWEGNGTKFQTWLYFAKKSGFTFDGTSGSLVQKSDWATPAAIPPKK
jgi:tetratricopeptide (TPR) repeat protein